MALSLNTLGNCLYKQGDAESHAESVQSAREAAQLLTGLPQAQRAVYLPDLAGVLTNLAARLSEQRDARSRDEALKCRSDATQIFRELARAQQKYLPDLARSLNNLASMLFESGDAKCQAEALQYAREAFEHFAHLARQLPAAFEGPLMMAAGNLARIAADAGLDAEEELKVALKASQQDPDSGSS